MNFTPKILVVDSDQSSLDLVGSALTHAGAEPHYVNSSNRAAEIMDEAKFDGVFLEWGMPEVNGMQLAGQIRSSKSNSLCPMVVLTASKDPGTMKECFRAGINFFLQKPVTQDKIQSVVKNV